MNDKEKKSGNYITTAWLVIMLALLYGGALAAVQMQLGPRIAENKRNETYDQIPELVPGAVKESVEELFVTDDTGRERRVYKAMDATGTVQGWVVPAAGQGFADKIEILVGLDAQLSTITGLFVLSQKETPGLGDYIREDFFCDRFVDKSTGTELEVVTREAANPHEIEALTGATISSESVTDIVTKTIKRLREPILQIETTAPPAGQPKLPPAED
jgi:electron transport complex protein RnfG